MKKCNTFPKLLRKNILTKENVFEILEFIGTGVLLIDVKTHIIIYANKEIEKISGYEAKELVGRICHNIVFPTEIGNYPITDMKQIHDQSERVLIHKTGNQVPVIKTTYPIRLGDEEILIESIIDDSKRKLALEELIESERSKSVMLAHLPGMAYRCNYNRDWTMQFVSEGSSTLTGYRPESLIYNKDLSYSDIIRPEYREIIWNEYSRVIKEDGVFSHEYPIITASGDERWVLEQGQPIYGEDGEAICLEGLIVDINGQKKAEEKLKNSLMKIQQLLETVRSSEERFKIAQEMSPDGFTILHPVRNGIGEIVDFTWVYENPAIARINHTDPQEVIGRRLLEAFPEHQGTLIYEAYIHVANTGEVQIFEEVNVGDILSGEKWLRLLIVPMSKDIAILAQDITKRKIAESELIRIKYRDHLTGVYNRSYYEEIKAVLEDEENLPVSIIIAELNGLGLVNDAFGTPIGDKIIANTAQLLRHIVRDGDTLARTDGNEFSIIMPKTTREEARELFYKITQACESYNLAQCEGFMSIKLSAGYGTKDKILDSFWDAEQEAKEYVLKRKLLDSDSHYNSVITSIQAVVNARSSETESHCERLVTLTNAIGKKLGLESLEMDNLQLLSLLHDIGKVGVPDNVLNKPGKLSDAEWALMKQHTEIGYQIVKPNRELENIANDILSHHERWDGKGYPQGLKGDMIPLLARILAIVDTYDAMTHDRPYRKAMSSEEAINEINRNAGTQFDPTLVSIFNAVAIACSSDTPE